MARNYRGGWNHDGVFKEKPCVVCKSLFKPKSGVHKFCSEQCKGKWQYITGTSSTENQYKVISGNWDRYVSRLMYYGGRKRDKLSKEIILKKLEEQNYRCALSGLPLTCNLEKGVKFPTNVSIDRVKAGGPYTEDNIQLVCRALNSWRADLSTEEFVEWCRLVVNHADKRESED
jgi:hypothetical protein